MATLRTLTLLGVGNQADAGSAPNDLARLAELAAGLATKSDLGHGHDASEVTGLAVALTDYLTAAVTAGYGVSVALVSGTGLVLGLVAQTNGGIVVGPEG